MEDWCVAEMVGFIRACVKKRCEPDERKAHRRSSWKKSPASSFCSFGGRKGEVKERISRFFLAALRVVLVLFYAAPPDIDVS